MGSSVGVLLLSKCLGLLRKVLAPALCAHRAWILSLFAHEEPEDSPSPPHSHPLSCVLSKLTPHPPKPSRTQPPSNPATSLLG